MNIRRKKFVLFVITVLAIAMYFPVKGYLRINSTAFNWLFSPNDFYEPLAKSGIDLSKPNEIVVRFKNKYPGLHAISLLVDNSISIPDVYNPRFIVDISVLKDDKIVFHEISKDQLTAFYGKQRGFFLTRYYHVPEDMPLGIELKACVKVIKPDPEFKNASDNPILLIEKMSDE